jgi:hypothetical protein
LSNERKPHGWQVQTVLDRAFSLATDLVSCINLVIGLLRLGTLDVKDAMAWKKRLMAYVADMFNEPLSCVMSWL